MKLFHHPKIKEEFNDFNQRYQTSVYKICPLLKDFSINIHTIDEYKKLLETHPEIPVIDNLDEDVFGVYIFKSTSSAKGTISGIIINEKLCLDLKLTSGDKFAAIAHEIGHIMFFFLENKQIEEEFKADEFACKMGLSEELLGLLQKLKNSGIYNETTTDHLRLRIEAIRRISTNFRSLVP